MIEVKIECLCGQHYVFDVEPVNGQMAGAVACPVCGADGTAAANELITRQMPPPTSAPTVRLHVHTTGSNATPAPAHLAPNARQFGQASREQAEIEARAKLSWGDPPEEVTQYLMLQGFGVAEAKELVQVMFKERLSAVRAKGIRKIVGGIGLMFVPVITFLTIGLLSLKLMGVAIMAGLYGVWLVINGILMVVAPKLESGDLVEE